MKLNSKSCVLAMSFSAISIALFGCSVNANPPEKNTQPPAVIQQTVVEPETVVVDTNTQTTGQKAVNVRVSFEQVVQLAERHTQGKAVEVDLQRGVNTAIYDVETVAGTHEHHVQIDAVTGQVLSSYSERGLNVPPLAKIGLLEAIQKAQGAVKGQVLSVSFEQEYINPEYEVKILGANGHPYEIKVHGNTGAVSKVKVEYDDDHDDD